MRGDWDHRGRAKQDESGEMDAAAKAVPLGAKIKTIVVWLGSGLTAFVVVVFAFVAAYDVFSGSVYVHAHVPADMEDLGR
jgi:hypothetical protein